MYGKFGPLGDCRGYTAASWWRPFSWIFCEINADWKAKSLYGASVAKAWHRNRLCAIKELGCICWSAGKHDAIIITVCDNAAGEICPIWPGMPVSAHWGVVDPAAVTGSDEKIAAAFDVTYD